MSDQPPTYSDVASWMSLLAAIGGPATRAALRASSTTSSSTACACTSDPVC